MALGMSKGVSFDVFCKLVKRLQLVVIDGRGEIGRLDLPLNLYNVPNFNIQVKVQ